MITGKEIGSGKYHYHKRSCGNRAVYVSNMPEDSYKVRVAFQHNSEAAIPILRMDLVEAELLWGALNAMAKEFEWKDIE